MSATSTLRPPLATVLTTLVDEGALDASRAAQAQTAHDAWKAPMPWYVRAFTGLGAWVAALFACAFVAGYHPTPDTQLVLGLTAVACAIGIRRGSQRSLPSQLGLVLALMGEMIAIAAVRRSLGSDAAAGLTLALELTLLVVYPDPLMRFMATIGASVAAIHLCDLRTPDVPFVLSLAAALALLHARPRLERHPWHGMVAPMAYGLAVVAMGLVLGSLGHRAHHQLGLVAIGGAALLAMVVSWRSLREQRAPRDAIWVTLAAIAALAATCRSPGILSAVALLTVAFGRRDTKMLALASVFLLFFGSWFYYSLATTLLAKSLALAGSGALLLIARAWAEVRFARALQEVR
jgi:hypothetical protein